MPPPRAKALDLSQLSDSQQAMVPQTPINMPSPWPVYGSREYNNSHGHHGHDDHGRFLANHGRSSSNPSFGMPSPRMVGLLTANQDKTLLPRQKSHTDCLVHALLEQGFMLSSSVPCAGARNISMARCHDPTCFRQSCQLPRPHSTRPTREQLPRRDAAANLCSHPPITPVTGILCS